MGGRNHGWGLLLTTALLTAVLATPVEAAGAAEAAASPASAARTATMTDLGTLPGGTHSSASAINELGQITGTANADFHAGGSAQGSVEFVADGSVAEPGYAGVGG